MGILDGKVVLVTGSGRGVGRGHALLLAQEGAAVVVNDIGVDVRGEGTGEEPTRVVVDRITAAGGNAVANNDDISTWEGARRAVQHGIDHFGRLDGVVNNAGITRPGDIADLSEDDFDALTRVHLKGSFATSAHACRYWRDRHSAGEQLRAAIVNTTSDSAFFATPSDSAYAAMKAAVAQLTLCGSREAAQYGVRMNAVGPRAYTRMARALIPGYDMREADEYDHESPHDPSNSSPLVAWLLSDAAAHVTGQVFRTLGGGLARVRPWQMDPIIYPPDGRNHFSVNEIGHTLNTQVFGCAFPDLRIDFAPGDPRNTMQLATTPTTVSVPTTDNQR